MIRQRVLAPPYAIKRRRFTQDSGFNWFVGGVGRKYTEEREREHEQKIQRYSYFIFLP